MKFEGWIKLYKERLEAIDCEATHWEARLKWLDDFVETRAI